MARVKRGIASHSRKKRVLKQTKGFRWGRKAKYRLAKDALRHAQEYAFRDRRAKKRTIRQDWQRTLGGALQTQGLNYSTFINSLKKQNVILDRKILSQLAKENPEILEAIVKKVTAKA